ncbi:acylphosphatase [Acinetobacter bouvetii]|uniref:acylphosphatase n=1 Tax=Acinetobacter bouvetii TaxID=202951 RepID=A0A811GAT1_9GAMM|nr:acylphosphatase [Acinetobacter bouvetii]CAB1213658.1 Acylphosphatase [Acinetobacter bouvetii]
MNKAMKLIIQGKVQAVGYRRWFEQQAIALGLKGYVKNLQTGDVEAVIIGPAEAVQNMIQRSHIGPARAAVKQIIQMELDQDLTRDFKIFETLI